MAMIGFLVGVTPALMALAPWDFGSEMTNFRALMRGNSLIVPIVELCCIFWALRLKLELFETIRSFPLPEKIALAALVSIAAFTSFSVANNIPYALMSLLMWLMHILFGVAVFQIASRSIKAEISSIYIGVSAGILAYLFILVAYIPTIESPAQYNWAGLMPGLPNIRSLGYFSVAGVAAGAAISFGTSRKSYFLLGLFIGAAAFGLAVWSATRGALFALSATSIFLFICRFKYRNLRFVGWVASAIAIGVLLSAAAYKPTDQFGLKRLFASVENSGGSIDRLSAGRVQIWKDTIAKIEERPLFGYGERQFRRVGPLNARGLNQPHNIFLQIAFQWGIVGAVLFFLLLARLVLRVWRQRDHGNNIGIGEQILIISTLVYSLYDAALFYPYPIMMFTLAVAIALAHSNQPAPAGDRSD